MRQKGVNINFEEKCQLLVEKLSTLEGTGRSGFDYDYLGDVIDNKNIIGNIIEEMVNKLLILNKVDFRRNPNSQAFPDFYLDTDNTTKDLLEVKAYDVEQSPKFDIADFKMYVNKLVEKPYVLNTLYLIVGYKFVNDGEFKIVKVETKKVWELVGRTDKYPLSLQVKRGIIENIRPASWDDNYLTRKKYTNYDTMEDFVSAVLETAKYDKNINYDVEKLSKDFLSSYREHYGVDIVIPSWDDVKNKYELALFKSSIKYEERLREYIRKYQAKNDEAYKETLTTIITESEATYQSLKSEFDYQEKNLKNYPPNKPNSSKIMMLKKQQLENLGNAIVEAKAMVSA